VEISLIHGAVPWIVKVLAVTALGTAVVLARPGWGAVVVRQAMLAAAAMTAIAAGVAVTGVVPYHFPTSFYVWFGVVAFSALLARAGWAMATAGQRLVSIAAVVCTAVLAATLINTHYAYRPTLASIFGVVSRDERSPTRPGRVEPAVGGQQPDHDRGTVMPVDPPATVSGFTHRPGFVYLPPAWFSRPRPPLGTVLMLGGTPGWTSDWLQAGSADQTADDFAARHGGTAPVLIFADSNGSGFGDSECVDGPAGHAESYLTVDVHRWAVDVLGVSPDPARWAVVGLSEGGTCAIMLALRHPDLFRSVADFSGDLTPGTGSLGHTVGTLVAELAVQRSHDPSTLLATNRYPSTGGWFEVGAQDARPLAAARTLAAAAGTAGIETHLVVRQGGHNYGFWTVAFRNALPWLAGRLDATV
jgi:pimeloyl-ACP methyl ester carboxylesterase